MATPITSVDQALAHTFFGAHSADAPAFEQIDQLCAQLYQQGDRATVLKLLDHVAVNGLGQPPHDRLSVADYWFASRVAAGKA